MDSRKVMYGAIIVVCILSIIAGIYDGMILKKASKSKNNITNNTKIEQKSQETLKREFNNLFDNSLHLNGYDTSLIKKGDNNKEIVYTAYDIEEVKEDKYEVDIKLPIVNINTEVGNSFNTTTQSIFADKATQVLNDSQIYTIYSISYTGYINGDILSIIIKSTLKEGSSAQRIIVQTYNYNLKTDKQVTIYDVIAQKNLTTNTVSKEINNVITNSIKEANKIQASGYETYARDINNDMYQLENISTFFIGSNGKLYIIFAYGNNSFTSEMDIIEM